MRRDLLRPHSLVGTGVNSRNLLLVLMLECPSPRPVHCRRHEGGYDPWRRAQTFPSQTFPSISPLGLVMMGSREPGWFLVAPSLRGSQEHACM
jgi:hypothetical protein